MISNKYCVINHELLDYFSTNYLSLRTPFKLNDFIYKLTFINEF